MICHLHDDPRQEAIRRCGARNGTCQGMSSEHHDGGERQRAAHHQRTEEGWARRSRRNGTYPRAIRGVRHQRRTARNSPPANCIQCAKREEHEAKQRADRQRYLFAMSNSTRLASAALGFGFHRPERNPSNQDDAGRQEGPGPRRNFARAAGLVVMTRVSVRKIDSAVPTGSARSVHTILT